uniref:RRM domain-containing protein n=1 Tax=Romanomermis culicivorax TaxID=13658 RepID=A0A915HH05_ROMCU
MLICKFSRKIFIGGLTRNTTVDTIRSYFGCFGNIVDAIVMTDQNGQSRGFGFVTYDNMESVQHVLRQGVHFVDSKQVDVKRSVPKSMRPPPRQYDVQGKKAFVGGLPSDLTEVELKEILSIYGKVTDCTIMYDEKTLKSRGFGFIGFEDETVVDKLLKQQYIQIRNKQVEVKPARPRMHPDGQQDGPMSSFIGPSIPGGGGFGDFYRQQNYGGGGAGSMMPGMGGGYHGYEQLVAQSFMNSLTGGGGGGVGGNAAANDSSNKRGRGVGGSDDPAAIASAASAYAAYGYGAYAPYPGTTAAANAASNANYDPYGYYSAANGQQQQQQQYPYGYMQQSNKPDYSNNGQTGWSNYQPYNSGYYGNGTNQ